MGLVPLSHPVINLWKTANTLRFMSNGSIIIEKKEEIKKRIKRSPDWFDSLIANTFAFRQITGCQ